MQSFKFSTALVRFYLKGQLSVDLSVVHLQLPQSLLGIFPVGVHKEAISLKHISSVKRNFIIAGRLCLFGLGFVAFGLFAEPYFPIQIVQAHPMELGILLRLAVVLGIVMVLASFSHVVYIEKDGRDIAWTMPFYEGKKARDIESVLTVKLYDDADKTDLGLHGFKQTGSSRPPELNQP